MARRFRSAQLNKLAVRKGACPRSLANKMDYNLNHGKQNTPLVITGIRDQARDVRAFDLLPFQATDGHGVSFIPGQVAMLQVNGEPPAYFAFARRAGRPGTRNPGQCTIWRQRFDFNEMERGARLELIGVAGHGFPLDPLMDKDLVFVAMGTERRHCVQY